MNFKQIFATPVVSSKTDITFLLLRIVCGLGMAMHGWGKIQNPFGWMGDGAPVPGFFQLLAAISEFGGGIALLIGLLIPLAMLGLSITMLVAVSMHAFVLKDPFVASGPGQGSYELASIYLMVAIMFMLSGPGRFSLDRKFFGTK